MPTLPSLNVSDNHEDGYNDYDIDDDDDNRKTTSKKRASTLSQKDLKQPQQSQQLCLNWRFNMVRELSRRIPVLKKGSEHWQQIPSHYKWMCFWIWILWKVVATFIVLYVVHHSTSSSSSFSLATSENGATTTASVNNKSSSRGLKVTTAAQIMSHKNHQNTPPITKVLYIITSLAEFNTGQRSTIKGQDRLGEVLLPILVDGVESMVTDPRYSMVFQVDVVLILAYKLSSEREDMIRYALPPTVGLEIWDDACPLGYDRRNPHGTDHLVENTRALARQHRYVIRDKLPYYDVFLAFEDDMRITAEHVTHFITMSQTLQSLRQGTNPLSGDENFFGPLVSREQIDRLLPGFIRVEVLLNEAEHGAQTVLDPIPLDYQYDNNHSPVHFDPRYCCHIQMHPNPAKLPTHPDPADVVIWETSVKALSVRELDEDNDAVGWVALLPGPGKRIPKEDLIPGFWSGRLTSQWDAKPSGGQPDMLAQQGGLMLTREQIFRLNRRETDVLSTEEDDEKDEHPQLCQGSFLPPFDERELLLVFFVMSTCWLFAIEFILFFFQKKIFVTSGVPTRWSRIHECGILVRWLPTLHWRVGGMQHATCHQFETR
jgi:hypothetical protein